jgi:hypothetical protein
MPLRTPITAPLFAGNAVAAAGLDRRGIRARLGGRVLLRLSLHALIRRPEDDGAG